MAKTVELRRHTEADGDTLTSEGVRAAVETASKLASKYDLAISSGAQRATQTLACFLAAGATAPGGVIVDARFKSDVEDRWKAAYEAAGPGTLNRFAGSIPTLSTRSRHCWATLSRNGSPSFPREAGR